MADSQQRCQQNKTWTHRKSWSQTTLTTLSMWHFLSFPQWGLAASFTSNILIPLTAVTPPLPATQPASAGTHTYALCIYTQPQTLIAAGMCMMNRKCVHTACCGSFSLCGWLCGYPILPKELNIHVQVRAHKQTQRQSKHREKRVYTQNAHIIPVKGCACNDRVCRVGVVAYSQAFIRRQTIREEWTILALHFRQSVCIQTHKRTHMHTKDRMSNIHAVDTGTQTPKREILSEISKLNEKGKARHYVYCHTHWEKIYFIKHKL